MTQGRCSECGGRYQVRLDGKLRLHGDVYGDSLCPGSAGYPADHAHRCDCGASWDEQAHEVLGSLDTDELELLVDLLVGAMHRLRAHQHTRRDRLRQVLKKAGQALELRRRLDASTGRRLQKASTIRSVERD